MQISPLLMLVALAAIAVVVNAACDIEGCDEFEAVPLKRKSAYMRFGKRSASGELSLGGAGDEALEVPTMEKRKSAYMRFGKRKSAYMRFGKRSAVAAPLLYAVAPAPFADYAETS